MDPYGVITWVRARRRRRAAVRRHVSDVEPIATAVREAEWRRSWSKRVQVAAIAGLGEPLLALLGATWRVEVVGAEHVGGGDRRRPHRCIYAFWHGRILPGTVYFARRGIVVITSENFDGEWIARIIQRFGYGTARGSTSRGGARALRELLRDLRHAPAALHRRRAARAGAGGPARRGLAGARPPAIRSSRFNAKPNRHWTVAQLGSHADPEAVRHASRWRLAAPIRVPARCR